MPRKRYTVAEANALLPHLAPTLIELRDKAASAAEIQTKIDASSVTNGGSSKRERWSRVLARVRELIERLEEWEVQLRDLESGLVDLPAQVNGEDAFLCWKLGEPEVAHWHSPEDGFQGRRPL